MVLGEIGSSMLKLSQEEVGPEKPKSGPNDIDPTKTSEENQLDAIIVEIGQFGPFQVFNYILLCLPIICNAFYSISYVFTAGDVPHRCNITLCDGLDSRYEEQFLNFTTPQPHGNWVQCERYAVRNDIAGEPSCNVSSFDMGQRVPCDAGYKLRDDEKTIATEFGLFCADQWKLSMVGTVNNIGQFVGIPLGGYFADRYGRKFILVSAGILSSIAGLARSHAPEYYSFLCLEFLDMVVGSTLFPTAFLLAVELVGPKYRVLAATTISLTYGLAEALMGYMAKYLPDWRVLLRVLYTPALLHLVFISVLSESVRWLLSQSKEMDAQTILRRVAQINRKELSEHQLNELILSNRRMVAQSSAAGGHYSFRQIFQALGCRTALCCFVWFTHTLVALGLSLHSAQLSGSKFENFSMTGLMQLPGILMATTLMNWIGRRRALSSCQFTCAVLLLAVAATDAVYPVTSSTLYFLAKMTSTGSFMILYFFTSEIFPTNCRNCMLSFCSCMGRFGSMLSPQTTLLIPYYKYGPHLLFALFCFTCSVLVLFFPETTNKVLPTTLAEARALDKSIPKEKLVKSAV
ncbi:solute carrier family 22 member 3-like isoform X1 [Drosophila santomea]|uniref:solute carrier family 22 member 3-like isoform X1 n=1 Tax=Drosophila santomea TaxID=129105 RepID=UPI00195326BA|nr:solute carrier family 22 member 3-like isoform X1 [Drosophila santomea]